MFEGTDSVLKTSVSSNTSYKSFKTQNFLVQNSYCDHRNFDSDCLQALTNVPEMFNT